MPCSAFTLFVSIFRNFRNSYCAWSKLLFLSPRKQPLECYSEILTEKTGAITKRQSHVWYCQYQASRYCCTVDENKLLLTLFNDIYHLYCTHIQSNMQQSSLLHITWLLNFIWMLFFISTIKCKLCYTLLSISVFFHSSSDNVYKIILFIFLENKNIEMFLYKKSW